MGSGGITFPNSVGGWVKSGAIILGPAAPGKKLGTRAGWRNEHFLCKREYFRIQFRKRGCVWGFHLRAKKCPKKKKVNGKYSPIIVRPVNGGETANWVPT